MIPVFTVEGESTAITWEKALLKLWNDGISIQTQYDKDPNTGVVHPASKDCMMTMIVKNSLAEPRFHVGVPGSPEYFGDYYEEVVNGIRDHWVRKTPEGKEWIYTYSGRLRRWGDYLNFVFSSCPSTLLDNFEERTKGFKKPDGSDIPFPWTKLAYRQSPVTTGKHADNIQNIEPFDQISFIVDSLVESPYTRRAVATTAFPPGDAQVGDPPCLRQIWCRGYYEGNCMKIDMHTCWRSRDGFKASLFNMFAMSELHREIVQRVMEKTIAQANGKTFCPRCGGDDFGGDLAIMDWQCKDCGLYLFDIRAGAMVDTSDSFHIYGQDHKDFVNKFIPITQRPSERKFWDLSESPYKEMVEEGKEKARKQVAERDARQ